MEAHSFTRVGAFIIDILFLALLLGLLTFWIPTSKAYEEAYEDEINVVKEYQNHEIDETEFMNRYFEDNYTKDKETVVTSFISVILSLGYFGTFAYYNDGQTLGKKLLKIKVVSSNNDKAKHINLIVRALIINDVLVSLLSSIIILFITKNEYVYTIGILQLIEASVLIISLIMMAFRSDKKGIHDFIAGTKVVIS